MESILFPVALPCHFSHSNGISVILNIAKKAQQYGYKVALCPAIPLDQHTKYRLPDEFSSLSIADNNSRFSVAIVTDTISQGHLAYIRDRVSSVCHYACAPYGLFSKGPFANPYLGTGSDRHAVFSPMVSVQFPYFYYQTVFSQLHEGLSRQDDPINPLKSSHQIRDLKVCIYSGKGHLRQVPHALRRLINRSRSVLIHRHYPASKSELYRLISESDALISFDPLTSLSLEASLLGKPCLIMSEWDEPSAIDLFPVSLCGIAFNDLDHFLHLLKFGFDRELVLQSYFSAISANPESVSSLLSFALGQSPYQSPTLDTNSYWSQRSARLALLNLPSDYYPDLSDALLSFHLQDYIVDLLRLVLRVHRAITKSGRSLFSLLARLI